MDLCHSSFVQLSVRVETACHEHGAFPNSVVATGWPTEIMHVGILPVENYNKYVWKGP